MSCLVWWSLKIVEGACKIFHLFHETYMSRLPVSSELNKIAKSIASSKGRGILVGGAVRDHFMDRRISKDLDVEVFGLSMQELESVLQEFGNIHAAGKSFGVLKLKTPTAEYDFSLPRREQKTGVSRRRHPGATLLLTAWVMICLKILCWIHLMVLRI